MNVFTYYDPVPGLADSALIDLWSKSWSRHGWSPIVLTRRDASLHPLFASFEASNYFNQTCNPVAYERACFLRWLAMVQAQGGLMSDWDVMNYGFTPNELPKFESSNRVVLMSGKATPCLVSGLVGAYQAIVYTFHTCAMARYTMSNGDNNTVSDQNILKQMPQIFDTSKMCPEVGEDGWKTSTLVHYPNARVAHPKSKNIPLLRT